MTTGTPNVWARIRKLLGLRVESVAEGMGISVERIAEFESMPNGELSDNLETIRAYLVAMGLGPAPRRACSASPFNAAQLADLAFLGLLYEAKPGVFRPSSELRLVFGEQLAAERPSLRLVVPPNESTRLRNAEKAAE